MVEPDLSAASRWLAARSPTDRKRNGIWPTPFWLCQQVVDQLNLPPGVRVVDPACGDGRWLLAVARRVPNARLTGLDIDPLAVEVAAHTLSAAGVHADLQVRDALADGAVPACDWVVGNPPFVRPQHLPREQARALWSRHALATDKVDLSACFVERALAAAPRVALVLPEALLSLASWAAVRDALRARGVDAVYTCPAGVFGAAIAAVVVVAAPDDRRWAGTLQATGFRPLDRAHLGTVWTLTGAPPELAGDPLDTFVRLHMGIVCGDYPRYVHIGKQYPEDRPTCRGRDVLRWDVRDRGEFVRYVPHDMLARKPYVAPKHAGLFDVAEKLVIAGTTGREIRAALDVEHRFPMDSCYIGLPRRPEIDLYAVLGLLLSSPIRAWYGERFGAQRVKAVELASLPFPRGSWAAIGAAARARDEPGLDDAVRRAYAAT